jgi:hypothetical protein
MPTGTSHWAWRAGTNFDDPRAIGSAMNGRRAFVHFIDSSRMGQYAFAMFVADYHNCFGIAYRGRFKR